MHQEIFQLFQSTADGVFNCESLHFVNRRTSLRLKRKSVALDLLPLAFRAHHFVGEQEQPLRLRRKFVERAAQHFMREPVGRRDIVERHFDVFERLAAMRHGLPWPLVLVQAARSSE